MNETLAVIMPVYNEESAIAAVIEKWVRALDALRVAYEIHAYNDGSKDTSLRILNSLAQQHPQVRVHDKKNSGHGPTILLGYRENAGRHTWLFQMDSDDEMGPESFATLWENRQHHDFLIGTRDGRHQPLSRKVVSFVSRLCVRVFYGKGVWDVNSPYRLMRSEKFARVYNAIPADTFAPNIIISGMAARLGLRFFECPVPHENRKTGTVSIKKWKLFKAAARSFAQAVAYARKPNP